MFPWLAYVEHLSFTRSTSRQWFQDRSYCHNKSNSQGRRGVQANWINVRESWAVDGGWSCTSENRCCTNVSYTQYLLRCTQRIELLFEFAIRNFLYMNHHLLRNAAEFTCYFWVGPGFHYGQEEGGGVHFRARAVRMGYFLLIPPRRVVAPCAIRRRSTIAKCLQHMSPYSAYFTTDLPRCYSCHLLCSSF